MYQKKSDDAISPVIGVMLMLVVTIVIAAVVVAFSTGMVSETNAVAPAAAFDVEIYSSFNDIVPSMHITHVSGDPVDTADMKLTFTWECPYPTCPSGVGHVHSSSYEFVDDGRWGYYDGRGGTDCDGIPFGVEGAKETSGYFGSTVQPLYINHGLGANVEYDDGYNYDGAYFGYITLKRGMTVYAYEQHLPKGDGNPAMDILLNNGDILVEPVEADSGEGFVISCPVCGESSGLESFGEAGYMCSGGSCWQGGCPDCGASGWPNPFNLDTGICSACGYDMEYPDEVISVTGFTSGIMACLPIGTPVDVTIVHIPSNKPIFEKTVYVQ